MDRTTGCHYSRSVVGVHTRWITISGLGMDITFDPYIYTSSLSPLSPWKTLKVDINTTDRI